MKVIREYVLEEPLDSFASRHGLVLKIVERGKVWWNTSGRYYAMFERCDLKEGAVLVGAFGNGATPIDAANAYAARISGEMLVVGAFSDSRREIQVPRLLPILSLP